MIFRQLRPVPFHHLLHQSIDPRRIAPPRPDMIAPPMSLMPVECPPPKIDPRPDFQLDSPVIPDGTGHIRPRPFLPFDSLYIFRNPKPAGRLNAPSRYTGLASLPRYFAALRHVIVIHLLVNIPILNSRDDCLLNSARVALAASTPCYAVG